MPIIQAARRAGVTVSFFFLLVRPRVLEVGAEEEEEARVVPIIQAARRAGVTAPLFIYLFIYLLLATSSLSPQILVA